MGFDMRALYDALDEQTIDRSSLLISGGAAKHALQRETTVASEPGDRRTIMPLHLDNTAQSLSPAQIWLSSARFFTRSEMGLSEAQFEALRSEGAELDAPGVAAVLHLLSAQVDLAIVELRAVDPATLGEFRGVGRARLPSTVIGCLVHGAEHAMRHVGQLSVTARIVRSGAVPASAAS